jgi:hypothetical protein
MKLLQIAGFCLQKITLFVFVASLIFCSYRGNQPMSVSEAPEGMTYFEFMRDRLDAASEVKPQRCGWGMLLVLGTLGPVYSVVYTSAGIHPDGLLGRMAAPDPDIPTGVEGAPWFHVPEIWWGTVERLSWSLLADHATHGCHFRPVDGQ